MPWRGALVIKEEGGCVEWCRGSARLEMEAAGRWIRFILGLGLGLEKRLYR